MQIVTGAAIGWLSRCGPGKSAVPGMKRQHRSIRSRDVVSVFLLAACGGQEAELAEDAAPPAVYDQWEW